MSLLPTDDCRFPVLSPEGKAFLQGLREHPFAPRYRDASGHRLGASEIEAARAFHDEEIPRPACTAARPPWLEPYVASLRRRVPFFRLWPEVPFGELPTTSRADLARDITAFVPDDVSLERLLHFETTGTTGHRISIPSSPLVAARHLAFLRKALGRHGIGLQAGRGDLGVALCGFQESCFTYVSVNPVMDEAGVVKLNLHPADWKDPGDRARYLDALRPELVTGDPLSLPELARSGMTHRPRAALSTSMSLSPGLRRHLETQLGCPVVDVYSLNESGPVASKDPGSEAFRLLQSRLLVEIVDEEGIEVPDGERGEIALTGGFNDCLPLLRYRTGDHARRDPADRALLRDLEGRSPVVFLDGKGRKVNNIEISQALTPYPLSRFQLLQRRDGSLLLELPEACCVQEEVVRTVQELLGRPVERGTIRAQDKVVAYRREEDV